MIATITHTVFGFVKSRNLLVLFFVLQAIAFYGQDLSYIYGKVVDSRTGEPLAFASISQKDKSVGLISNDDGSFKIPAYFATANATMVVSFIGYFPQEILVANLDKNNLNIIKLVEKTESLNEIVIKNKAKKRTLNAEMIVQAAIKNIVYNYPFKSFSYVGYYRDYQKTEYNTYVNLNEAILHVYDPGFGFKDHMSSDIQIYKYSKNQSFPTDTIASQPYDYANKTKVIKSAQLGSMSNNANEFALLRVHDAIRNYNINTYDFVNNLQINFVNNHSFEIIRETSIDNVSLYEIRIFKYMTDIFAEGSIFISKDDYKIYKFQYAIYKGKQLKRGTLPFIDASSLSARGGQLIMNVTVEYTNYNEIMYPQYISFNNPFEIVGVPKFFPTKATFGSVETSSGETLLYVDTAFNNKINPKKASKKRNYRLKYKGGKIRIDSIRVMDKTLRVYPKDDDVYFPKKAWLEDGVELSNKDFTLEIKNLKDVYGNIVYKGKMTRYNQYREFFIQELNINPEKPKNALFMIKSMPISGKQPIKAPKDISKYWMNSPLKQ